MYNLPKPFNNKYYNIYIKIIDKYKNEHIDESIKTEVHHILPKCMGGANDSSNLVKLPVKYHIMCHYLLTMIYPDNIKLKHAMSIIAFGNNREDIVNKSFSIRTIERIRLSWITAPNANSRAVKSPSGIIYSSIKEAAKNESISYSTLCKWITSDSNNHGWSYYNCSKCSNYNRNQSKSKKKVVSPTGVIYDSIQDACNNESIPYTTLRYWLSGRTRSDHNWKFA